MSDTPLRRDPDDLPSLPDPTAALTTDTAMRNEYAAILVSDDDGSSECTIFPVYATAEDLVTTWISAEEGAYVALAAMR